MKSFSRLFTVWLVPLLLAELFPNNSLAAFNDSSLVYRTPQGVEYEVNADGLSAICVNGRTLARGGWSAWNGESWFKAGPGAVKSSKAEDKHFEKLSPNQARVRHVKEDLVCLFDYTFEGEDVTISARIENNHTSAEMAVTGFSGLEFTFERAPDGLMQEQHISYFQAHGVGLCHPSFYSKIGGSYARDDAAGVGVSPWRTGFTRTLILWDYTDWNPGKREKLPSRRLLYFVVRPVPPRGAQTFQLKLRVSPDRDWKHLLAPYREHFQDTFGPVRYETDHRWIATDYLNHSQRAVSPSNPYGFHGGHRRIDTAEGAAAFCNTIIPALKTNDGQGIIVWGQGGDDPRGGMYRPDFDVVPPEVEAQWTNVIAPRFKEAGVRLGVTTRPHDMAVKLDWRQDQIISINPDDPGHREMLWRRFDKMLKKGCSLFYLDSFGASFEDVKLMRWLREKLGPGVRTYCEHQCDAIVPFSGGYSETTLQAEAKDNPPHYRVWSGVETWEIYRWLCPSSELAARLYETKGSPPTGFESADEFYARHQIIPLVPVNDFARAPAIKALQSQPQPATGTAPARKTAPPLDQKPVDFNHPPRAYEPNRVREWTVLVEKQLANEDPGLTRRALDRLETKLGEAMAVLPASSHPRLQKLNFFLMYGVASTNGGRDNGLEYFQKTAPQHYPQLDPRMASGVVVYSASNYVWLSDFWALKALLHELAHAHHLEQWPESKPDIYDAWENAKKLGLYRNVQDDKGKPVSQAYALQNHLEYFAELSCAYFVGCNYYPFTRAELKAYDPAGFAMVEKLWRN